MRRSSLIVAIAALWFQAVALPAQQRSRGDTVLFFAGGPRLESITGVLDLDVPAGSLDVRMGGLTTSTRRPGTIGFRGAATSRFAFTPSDSVQPVRLPIRLERSGDTAGAQSVAVDLVLEMDGKPSAEPVGQVDVQILLPSGVPALIRSSLPLTQETVAGRTAYRLTRTRWYAGRLNLIFSRGPVTLVLEKSIQPQGVIRPGPVTVTVAVRNVGQVEARDVLLEDSFDPRDFSGTGEGFRSYAGQENDRRLLWSRRIASIAPGASATVNYTVLALVPVHGVSLAAAKASIAGRLVGVSNKVELPSASRARKQ